MNVTELNYIFSHCVAVAAFWFLEEESVATLGSGKLISILTAKKKKGRLSPWSAIMASITVILKSHPHEQYFYLVPYLQDKQSR